MKHYILALLMALLPLCYSCDSNTSILNRESKSKIEEAKQAAIAEIDRAADAAVASAEQRISASATNKLGEASKEIESAIQNAQNAISIEVKKQATEEINAQLKNTQKHIESSKDVARTAIFVGLIGILFGIVAIFLSIRAKNRSNSTRIRRIIYDAIYNDSDIYERINHLISESQKSANRTPLSISKRDVERIIEEYIASKKFSDILSNRLDRVQKEPVREIQHSAMDGPILDKPTIFYAGESNTNRLSTLQTNYQTGKSLYKLVLPSVNSTKANLTLCEQDDTTQRILGYDSQYIEPICQVKRLSINPTTVLVQESGIVERNGDDWIVTKPIIVEIK